MLLENKLIIIMTVINIGDTAIITRKENVFAMANGGHHGLANKTFNNHFSLSAIKEII